MADIRPKDLLPTAESMADDDFLLLDGAKLGTRKIPANAAVAAARVDVINGAPSGFQRKLTEKLRDLVSVEDFGAVDDDVTSNTKAIQAALDSGAPAVRFPGSGTYLTGPLTIRAPIILELGRATLKLASGSDGDIITIAASNVSIRGGILDGNRELVTNSRGIFVSTLSGGPPRENIHLSGIEIHSTASSAIRVGTGSSNQTCTFLVIERCYIHDIGVSTESGSHGIQLQWKCPSARVINNRITATVRNGIWIGNGSDDLVVAYNDIDAVGRFGIEIWGQKDPPFPPKRVLVHGNKLRNGTANAPLSVDFCFGVIVSDNHLYNWDNHRAALEVVECHGAIIANNRLEDVTGRGIQIDETDDAIVANNHVENAGTTGIRMVNRALRTIIIGNRVVNSGTNSIESGNNVSDDVQIIGNTLIGGERAWFRSGGDVHRMLFANNRVINPSVVGVLISVTQDDSSILDNYFIGDAATIRAIDCTSGLQRVRVAGNTVIGFSGTGGIAIRVDSSSIAGAIVENNRAQNCATGLRISAPGTVVRDNDLRGATTKIDFGSNATEVVLRGNLGYATEASGSGTIPDSASSGVVVHGLAAAPTTIIVTARANQALWVSARSATTFTVTRAGTGGVLAFDWKAEVRP